VDGLAIGTINEDDIGIQLFTPLGKLSTSFSGESFATGVSDAVSVVGL